MKIIIGYDISKITIENVSKITYCNGMVINFITETPEPEPEPEPELTPEADATGVIFDEQANDTPADAADARIRAQQASKPAQSATSPIPEELQELVNEEAPAQNKFFSEPEELPEEDEDWDDDFGEF